MGAPVPAANKRKDSMAAIATQRAIPPPLPSIKPLLEKTLIRNPVAEVPPFDPDKHLAHATRPDVITMEEIGYSEDVGVSKVAVSQPFRLFAPEAVGHMRTEIFKPAVWRDNCFSSNLAACQLRGYAKEHAPFTYEAWTHPDTLKVISEIAGIDLVPEIDYEIAHINLSVKSEEQTRQELDMINRQKRFYADDEGIAGCPWEDNKPIVGWHTDSYPFVCVLMMSDCTDMVGGETAVRTGDGRVIKVRGPTQGCAVIMQGRYLTHQALRALGSRERITSVTSFRPRSSHVKDDTVLETVRPISDLSELYYEVAEYRLQIVEDRIRKAREDMANRRKAQKKFDTADHKRFLQESIAFLGHTDQEIIEDDKVIHGYIEEKSYPDVQVAATSQGERPTKRKRTE